MLEQIKQKLSLSNEKWEAYLGCFHPATVAAKTTLLHEGERSKKIFLVEKGCLRAWFNNNGKDVTFQFFFEGGVVSSVESFRKNIPSLISIEAIAASIVYWIDKNAFETILDDLKNNADLQALFISAIFDRMIDYMHHFLSFIRDTPTQRYLTLLKEYPHIVQRVPQHYIASYLGITTVHLSRIKNKLAKEPHR